MPQLPQQPAKTEQKQPLGAKRDALLEALDALCAHNQVVLSATTLTAGLPLQKGKLTPDLFIRAAARAGFQTRIVERSLDEISDEVLPVVLLLKDGDAALLTKLPPHGPVTLVYSRREVQLSREDLIKLYTGNAVYAMHGRLLPASEWFWPVLWGYKREWAQVIIASVIINLIALTTPLFTMNVYDRVIPNRAMETLWVLALGALAAFVFEFLLRGLRSYFIDIAGRGTDLVMSSRLFEQLQNLRLGQKQASTGAIASEIREFESLREFFTSATLSALVDLPFVLLFIGIVGLIGGPVALLLLVSVPLCLGVAYYLQAPLQRLIQNSWQEMSSRQGHLVEAVNGLETIKTIGAEGNRQSLWEKVVFRSAKLALRIRLHANAANNFAQMMQQAVMVLMVVWGAYRVGSGDMSMGALVACTLLAGRTMGPLMQMTGILTRYHQSRQALLSLNAFMLKEIERPEGKEFLGRPTLKGHIELRDVQFKYGALDMPSLKGVDFKVKAGEKVGIIGRSGSGKSTLARLLVNLYNPTEGQILLDGTEIRQINPAEIRRQMVLLPQKAVLFNGSLRDNLRMAAPLASDDELWSAIQLAGLTEVVNQHPQGLDRQVGEGGEGLSGGQAQSVALARGLLMNPSMLILDEPTAGMDTRLELQVKQTLRAWSKTKTLVLISHRASLLDLVDRLIVMEGGRVVMDGPRDEVLAKLANPGSVAEDSQIDPTRKETH